jgi:hypothetical protein
MRLPGASARWALPHSLFQENIMTDEYLTADEKAQALHNAEAASRRAESEANIFRSRASRSRDPEAMQSSLQEKIEAGQKAQEELDRINATASQTDLSGMSRGLSDSAGNFAPNVEVLKAGGIGVEASNTNVSTGEPALTAAEAGTGGPAVIPDDWRDLPVGERRALVVSLGGTANMKSADANDFIQAEVDRRSAAE